MKYQLLATSVSFIKILLLGRSQGGNQGSPGMAKIVIFKISYCRLQVPDISPNENFSSKFPGSTGNQRAVNIDNFAGLLIDEQAYGDLLVKFMPGDILRKFCIT